MSLTAPQEVETGNLLAQFGPQAVYGGQVPYAVMLRVSVVRAILRAHADSRKALNWAIWAQSNPDLHHLLADAKAAYDELHP